MIILQQSWWHTSQSCSVATDCTDIHPISLRFSFSNDHHIAFCAPGTKVVHNRDEVSLNYHPIVLRFHLFLAYESTAGKAMGCHLVPPPPLFTKRTPLSMHTFTVPRVYT